jgi:hypothetical protein
MRPTKRLSILHHKTSRRLSKFHVLADGAANLSLSEANKIVSYVVLETHTTLANFLRAYFLSSVFHPLSGSGVTFTCNRTIRTFGEAIDASMRRCKNNVWLRGGWDRRDEPPWHQPKTLIDSSNEIGCSNYSQILAAFSYPTTVYNDLTKFRNFYAHRNEHTVSFTKSVASSYSIPVSNHPTEILCTPAYGRPQNLILDWIDDIQNVTELLCA